MDRNYIEELKNRIERGEKLHILFVCHGNICRSPMGKYLMQDMVKKLNAAHLFQIDSAATSREEIGNGVHYGTRNKLARYNISCSGHRARQMTVQDYMDNDLLIGMDSANIRNMARIAGIPATSPRLCKMLEFCGSNRDVADPWYTDNFDETYDDIYAGCSGLLKMLGF